jgi:hypothetical protein
MAFRFRITTALTMLVAVLGWGLFIKAYMSRSAWRDQALAAAQCVAPGQAVRVAEPTAACVAPNQLLNYNLRQVNDVRINLQVGVQKLTEVLTTIQEKSRQLSGLDVQHQKLTADVALLNEQIQAKCIALAHLSGPTDKKQAPSQECP